ncbi:MAG: hypothetical protein LBE13_05820 [Bacteroidales bacterium]|jgi:phosphoserine phosphatase|nr:hypothetical protein [Bacteroidales bacterium]
MKKGVVVDLDGTLVSSNTFHKYIIFSFREAVKSNHFFSVFNLIIFVICRKFRIIKHDTMKFHVLNSTNSYMNEDKIKSFVSTLFEKINKTVLNILNEYKKNDYLVCLSTAAPEIYVNELFKELPQFFDFMCSTPSPSKEILWRENVRQVKCNNTILLLNSKNIELKILITDHFDDMPLLSIKKDLNILVNPSKQTIKKLNEQNIKYLIL